MTDDNDGCSVVITNSSVGRVVSGRSAGLNIYALNTNFTGEVAFYADGLGLNATNCTFGARVVDQLHGASGTLFFTGCAFLAEKSAFGTVFDAQIVV